MRPSLKTRTQGFTEQLREYTLLCAAYRFDEDHADAFLWNARRCLETMLRALLVPYPPKKFDELSVLELLKDAVQRTIVPYDLAQAFETLEGLSRLGARVQDHERSELSRVLPECSRALARSVTWFFESSSARPDMPAEVREALNIVRSIEKPASHVTPFARDEEQVIAELRTAVETREQALVALRSQVDVLAQSIEAERSAAAGSRVTLDQLHSELLTAIRASRAPGASRSRPLRRDGSDRMARALFGLGGLLVGALSVFAYGYLRSARVDHPVVETPGPTPIQDATSSDGSPPEVEEEALETGDSSPSLDVPILPDAAPEKASASGPCPDKMYDFEAAEVHVMQPFPRKNWPDGPEALDPVLTGRFCMDREPVLVSEYERCVASGKCRPRSGCPIHPRNFPVNCITWADASTYCRWRKGSLPNILQWERTLLSTKVRPEPARGTWEWTADPFPAPVLERGPARRNEDGRVWGYMALQKIFQPRKTNRRICSWHKAPADAARGNLSFRCVIALDD